jgi:hypothetical protein
VARQPTRKDLTPLEREVLRSLSWNRVKTLTDFHVDATRHELELALGALIRRRQVEERQPMSLHDPRRGLEYSITNAGRAAPKEAHIK